MARPRQGEPASKRLDYSAARVLLKPDDTMSNNPSVLVLTAMCFTLAQGCESASLKHENAVRAQHENALQAQAEANRKIAEAYAETKVEIVNAVAEADEKIAKAQAKISKLREDFRNETTKQLAEIDKDIADLEVDSQALTGPEKTEREAKLGHIRDMRDQFTRDYEALEAASAHTWDRTKAQLEKQLKALGEAIDDLG